MLAGLLSVTNAGSAALLVNDLAPGAKRHAADPVVESHDDASIGGLCCGHRARHRPAVNILR